MSKMLSSWKEIASFFGKGVRTVQRWETTLGLPIHRPAGAPSNVVLARTSDLEAWLQRASSTGVARESEQLSADAAVSAHIRDLEGALTVLAQELRTELTFADCSSTTLERLAGLKASVAHLNSLAICQRTDSSPSLRTS